MPNRQAECSCRGRLAPSPTGALHLGNARSFLVAWLSVRSRGGTVVLRMEDLDHPKVKPQAAGQAMEDLRWLGLDWDEGPDTGGPHGPYIQSERIGHYAGALARLRRDGWVYPCICSRRDVEAGQRAPHAGDEGPRYPGTCRGRFASYDAAAASLPPGRLPAWRFRAPDETIVLRDGFAGDRRVNVAARDGDFVIARHREGAGYMLAVVVDDAAMGITEVIRGDDLLPATPRQWLLYRALGLTPPRFIHLPLVTGTDGRRLAKRHGDTRIRALREAGVPASRVLGLLAHSFGWGDAREPATLEALLKRYRLDDLPRTPFVLSPEQVSRLETFGNRIASDSAPPRTVTPGKNCHGPSFSRQTFCQK